MGHKVAALKKEKLAEELSKHKLPVHKADKSHDVATCLYKLPLRALLILAGLAGHADSAVSRPAPFFVSAPDADGALSSLQNIHGSHK